MMNHHLGSTAQLISNQRGVSLIEVLVSVFVVSIGMLGVLGMQGIGLKSNLDAETTSKATLLVQDMANRMRTNMEAYFDGYTFTTETADALCPDTGADWTSTEISVQDKDLCDWRRLLEELQPGSDLIVGDVAVGTDGVAAGNARIRVQWEQMPIALISPDASTATFSMTVKLR